MNHHGEPKVVLILLAALFFISCNGKNDTGPKDGGKHEFELPTDVLGDLLVSDIGPPDMSPPKTEWVAMDEGHSMGSSWATGVAMGKSSDIFAVGSFKGTMLLGGNYYSSMGTRDMFWIRLSNKGSFKTFQQAGGIDARGHGVALDDSGNVIVVGDFSDTISFGGKVKLQSIGAYDMFIAKYTPTGKVLWAVSAGGTYVGPGADTANGVATGLSGDIFISGIIYESAVFGDIKLKSSGKDKFDSFVAKLDKNGKFKWVVRLDKSVGVFHPPSLASDSKGNCYVSGEMSNSATMGTTKIAGDMFVTKISPNGKFDWAVSGTAAVSSCTGGTVDSAGNSYITGSLEGKGTLGSITINSNGLKSGFLAKVSPTGMFLWARSLGTGGSGLGFAYAVTTGVSEIHLHR